LSENGFVSVPAPENQAGSNLVRTRRRREATID